MIKAGCEGAVMLYYPGISLRWKRDGKSQIIDWSTWTTFTTSDIVRKPNGDVRLYTDVEKQSLNNLSHGHSTIVKNRNKNCSSLNFSYIIIFNKPEHEMKCLLVVSVPQEPFRFIKVLKTFQT